MDKKSYTIKSISLLIASFISFILSIVLFVVFFIESIIIFKEPEHSTVLGYMIAIELLPAILFFITGKFLYKDSNIKLIKIKK